MSHTLQIMDMTAAEKRAELISIGFEMEQQSKHDSELSALLGSARSHPRPMFAGIFALPGATETLETIRPTLLDLDVGDNLITTNAADLGQTEKITYTRLSEKDARVKLSLDSIPQRVLKCPRCDAVMQLYYKRVSSDGYCGIEYADHICTDLSCGLQIERFYEGYGSIF